MATRTKPEAKKHEHKHAVAQEGDDPDKKEEMCCDGSGRTAEEHRKEAADGKCCIDE